MKQPSTFPLPSPAPAEPIPQGVRTFLQSRLIVTREIPNGRDFLFSEGSEQMHSVLKALVEFERGHDRNLQCDYVKVEEYFLLRIIGSKDVQERIQRFFNGGEEKTGT